MKTGPALIAAAFSLVSALAAETPPGASKFPWNLAKTPSTYSFHMKPIRAIQARVQGDMPEWDDEKNLFVSKYGSGFEGKFRSILDTVNTASVEGALLYVQAEGINYNTRSKDQQCTRKNGMKYVVFYDLAIAQTNETLALYEDEYGPMLPMDGGQCRPKSDQGKSVEFPAACYFINGDNGEPNVGPFVGAGSKETDPRAPYPNSWWFSFPNTCPLKTWKEKTDECRATTRTGLCPFDMMPDGNKCTFNYRILGFVPIDDLVGITSMKGKSGVTYTNFSAFCEDGGVEFKATEDGKWEEGLEFWEKPQDKEANAKRAQQLVETYNSLVKGRPSPQIPADVVSHFVPLPRVSDLAAENPPCYENVKKCATAQYGCRRDLFGQICHVCSAAAPECKPAPPGFTFPTLVKAIGQRPSVVGSGSASSSGPASAGVEKPGKEGTSNSPGKPSSGASLISAAKIASFLVLLFHTTT